MFDEIRQHADENPQQECCGFVVFPPGSHTAKLMRMRNVAEDANHSFKIDGMDYIRLVKEGYTVVAVYHSHATCDSELTDVDIGLSNRMKLPIYVYSRFDGKFNYYRPLAGIPEFVGRHFIEEIQDCKILVQDFFAKELGVRLKPFETGRHRIVSGMEDLDEYCSECGLERIPYPTGGAIVMMTDRSSGFPNHCGVMINEMEMLHQPLKETSRVEDLRQDSHGVVCFLKMKD